MIEGILKFVSTVEGNIEAAIDKAEEAVKSAASKLLDKIYNFSFKDITDSDGLSELPNWMNSKLEGALDVVFNMISPNKDKK